jgi:mRNA interferase MazF
VTLKKGEANMPAKCVINVTQIQSVDRTSLIEKIGTLSPARYQEVAAGLKLVLDLSD